MSDRVSARRLGHIAAIGVALAVSASPSLPQLDAASQGPQAAGATRDPRLDGLKKNAATEIDGMSGFTQQMMDQIFSFAELGYQEFETSTYLTGILEKNGFKIERGVAGMPTGWLA